MINKDFLDLIWKEFYFDQIFEVENGFYNKKPECSNSGRIPFLGATSSDNGITGFSSLEIIEKASKNGHGKNHSLEEKIFEGNCITVTNNGTSMGYAYYQKNEFTCSHDINPLYLKDHELNRYIASFLIVLIEKQKIRFEYSRKWRPERMKKSKILIPVTDEGIPDWIFMESYMKEKEKFLLRKYKSYLEEKLNQININKGEWDGIDISSKKWSEFFISDIGEIDSGKDIYATERLKGDIPYITAKSKDNGVGHFIRNENNTLESNCISVNRNGSVGYAFYHPYKALYSNDCRKIRLNRNKHISLFIANQITSQRGKYGYGYKMGTGRLKRQKIMLPIDDNNNPDWEFIESYMKKLEYEKISKYLNYIENRVK
ncbi:MULTISPECIES: restriction endonuclease subunit S [Methanobacterium]|uniref:Type I restriction modification DNA specificity domain-containing protein n=1 Tax=Methanobacterium bryantii TaxID=2161 RepID=A0A2A2H6Z7_METBR|nr:MULTISPECIES: restriction endonuclease subunit S [Methanobacterium]PAV05086.1 hypothetical protein ASJ80_12410 [Methanobacterium bryantii]